MAAARNKAAKSRLARKPLRGRESLRADPRWRWTDHRNTGLAWMTSSKGRRTSRKPDPAEAPDSREDVTTLEGIDSTGD